MRPRSLPSQQQLMQSSQSTPTDRVSTPSKAPDDITMSASPKFTLSELQDSRRRKAAGSNLIDRINQMELFYVGKIKDLEKKVIELENENEELRAKALNQNSYITQLQLNLELSRQQLDEKVKLFEKNVIQKVVEEADSCYQAIEEAKTKLQNQLNIQRKLRQTREQELKQTQEEKQHLHQFYKHVVQNHRRLLKADIERTKQSIKTYESEDLRPGQMGSPKKKKGSTQQIVSKRS